MFRYILIAALFLGINSHEAIASDNALSEAAKTELSRTMKALENEEASPYFIAYNIVDSEEYRLTASFGKLKHNKDNKSRILDIDLRVGDYKFDNTHIIRGNPFQFSSGAGKAVLPLENDIEALRTAIWYATDRQYKSALERYEKALTNQAVKVKEEDSSADFSREEPSVYSGPDVEFSFNAAKWKPLLEKLSSKFARYGWLIDGDITLIAKKEDKYIFNTEGAEIKQTETSARIYISAKTKAEDGMMLPLHQTYFSFSPSGLPGEETMAKDIEKMINLLGKLREAPMMQTYTGPAMLSGKAAGVFFHEIFGHRVEGHREKDPDASQTFKNSIGDKILPEFLDVVFDPTVKTLEGAELAGYYVYDDEGVKGRKVVTVENGIFKHFLMSRSPIENFPKSTGHGRKQAGYNSCSRQSNLIVKADETVSAKKMKEMLREECKKQDKEFGLYFDVVSGGFTFTSRVIPNSFNVTPLVVYKVYADGSPDELVRGVDLIGTPLATFSNIIAAGDDMDTFNGICGAESGQVPVSASSPNLLVSKIEVQKKKKSQAKPPVLPAP